MRETVSQTLPIDRFVIKDGVANSPDLYWLNDFETSVRLTKGRYEDLRVECREFHADLSYCASDIVKSKTLKMYFASQTVGDKGALGSIVQQAGGSDFFPSARTDENGNYSKTHKWSRHPTKAPNASGKTGNSAFKHCNSILGHIRSWLLNSSHFLWYWGLGGLACSSLWWRLVHWSGGSSHLLAMWPFLKQL